MIISVTQWSDIVNITKSKKEQTIVHTIEGLVQTGIKIIGSLSCTKLSFGQTTLISQRSEFKSLSSLNFHTFLSVVQINIYGFIYVNFRRIYILFRLKTNNEQLPDGFIAQLVEHFKSGSRLKFSGFLSITAQLT